MYSKIRKAKSKIHHLIDTNKYKKGRFLDKNQHLQGINLKIRRGKILLKYKTIHQNA